jgi:UDP-2,3-diacylglucosamine hydrolase
MRMDSSTSSSSIGIIAGNRKFPQIFAREARRLGVNRLVAVAFEGETEKDIEPLVDEVHWMKLGQLNKLIDAFKKSKVSDVVMVGQIAPKNLFANIRLDLRMTMLLAGLKRRNAETIFGAIGKELAKDGLNLVAHADFLKRLIAPIGVLTKRKPSSQEKEDLEFGFRIAKSMASMDIGQSVVVKQGTVLSVEAFEGTDAAILRGGELGLGESVAVKVTKPGQDMRFDIPCIGVTTIQTLKRAKISALGIEAGRTLLLEMEELLELANKEGIVIEALKAE